MSKLEAEQTQILKRNARDDLKEKSACDASLAEINLRKMKKFE